jgi:hypothetical protein
MRSVRRSHGGGILSVDQGGKIALYFTGPRHACENLAEVLKYRSKELPSPIQVCDALWRNVPKLSTGVVRGSRSCWLIASPTDLGNSWMHGAIFLMVSGLWFWVGVDRTELFYRLSISFSFRSESDETGWQGVQTTSK